jgi:hypothetical protein
LTERLLREKNCSGSLHELSEDVVEDATVLEVGKLRLGVDSDLNSELLAVISSDLKRLTDLEVASVSRDVESLLASEAKSVSRLAREELQGQHTHTNKVASMNALVALSDDSLDALKVGTLGGPVAGGTGTVLLTSEDNGVLAFLHVGGSSVPNGHLLPRGNMNGLRAHLVVQLVNQTGVGESTSGHDLEVASASTIRIEVLGLNAMLLEEAGGGRVVRDLSSGRDVISGNRISKVEETVSGLNVSDSLRVLLGGGEERRVCNVGRLRVPAVELASASFELLPSGATLEDIAIDLLEHLGLDHSAGHFLHLVTSGPDIAEVDILAIFTLTDGLGFEVDVDAASQCVSDDQGRRGQVVGASIGVHTALEVSVSREDSSGNKVIVHNGVLNLLGYLA